MLGAALARAFKTGAVTIPDDLPQRIEALLDRAVQLGLERVFCLTFEVEFFARHGFEEMA